MIPQELVNSLKIRSHRFPRLYEKDLLVETLMRTLVNVSQSFLVSRPTRLIKYLVCLQYFFCKKLLMEKDLKQRNLMIKLFRFSNNGTNTLSVAIGFNLLDPYEFLEEKHLYRALSSLIPGIEIVPDSFYSCQDRNKTFLFCYLEIKKLRGKSLSLKDIYFLRKNLPNELNQSIQTLTYSILFSRPEEEIYKNINQLANEIRSINDIPQVAIFFQDQIKNILNFSVVLVRISKKNDPGFRENFSLPSSTKLSIQKVIKIHKTQKQLDKEAIIFSLEVEHFLFLKKNWCVDLIQARNYVVKIIEQFFGPFRDYNGGLLSQQNKQLEQIKNALMMKGDNFSSLIQDLFSFNPPSFQALISTSLAKDLIALFNKFAKNKIFTDKVLVEEKKIGGSTIVFFKTTSSEYFKIISEEIKNLQTELSSSFGFSSFEFEKIYYLCFVGLTTNLQIDIAIHLKKFLQKVDSRKTGNEIDVLKLNFQEGDPLSLNPQIAIDQRCRCLLKCLFEGLTRLNSKNIPEPAAASAIDISVCQTIYTFTLRELQWSNGEQVTAYDFEKTWKCAITPDSNCLRPDLFYIIKNARSAHKGLKNLNEVKIKATHEKTLVVELEYPAFYFLHLLSNPIFSPLYKAGQEPTYFNGPFLLKEWKRNCYLHLSANPYYWDKKNVRLKDITINVYKDVNLIGQLFEKGELDWLGEPFNTSLPQAFSLHKKMAWKRKSVDQYYWIYLNTNTFPTSSVNIRKSLAYSIDRLKIMRKFKVKPQYLGGEENEWDGNKDLANFFFNEGLKELNIKRENFPKISLYWSFEGEEQVVQMIQDQIESTLKIEINKKRIPWVQLSYLLDTRDYQASTCYRSAPYCYSRSYLELFRESTNLYNSSQWENVKFKKLIDKALKCHVSEERENFLIKAEQLFFNEMPIIPVFFPNYQYLLNQKLKNVSIASNGDVDLKWTKIQI